MAVEMDAVTVGRVILTLLTSAFKNQHDSFLGASVNKVKGYPS